MYSDSKQISIYFLKTETVRNRQERSARVHRWFRLENSTGVREAPGQLSDHLPVWIYLRFPTSPISDKEVFQNDIWSTQPHGPKSTLGISWGLQYWEFSVCKFQQKHFETTPALPFLYDRILKNNRGRREMNPILFHNTGTNWHGAEL